MASTAMDDTARADHRCEVYAVTREFVEWGKGFYQHLPNPIREGLRAAGVCHYTVVIRDVTDGTLTSFDFAPPGGDVTGALAGGFRGVASAPDLRGGEEDARDVAVLDGFVDDGDDEDGNEKKPAPPTTAMARAKSWKDLARAVATSTSRRARTSGAIEGEIRERTLEELPDGHHFVGTTSLTVDEIREWNAKREKTYHLNQSDCRHYMNDLCAHACPDAAHGPGGVSSAVAWKQTWCRLRDGKSYEALHLLPVRVATDLRNKPAIDRLRSAFSASFAFGLGMRACAVLFRPIAAVGPSIALVPGVVAKALPARRLVTAGAGAVAGVSAEVPVVREAMHVGNGVLSVVGDVATGVIRGAGSVIGSVSTGLLAGGSAAGVGAAGGVNGAGAGAIIAARDSSRAINGGLNSGAAVAVASRSLVVRSVAGAGGAVRGVAKGVAGRAMKGADGVKGVAGRAARATKGGLRVAVSGLKKVGLVVPARTTSTPRMRRLSVSARGAERKAAETAFSSKNASSTRTTTTMSDARAHQMRASLDKGSEQTRRPRSGNGRGLFPRRYANA